jgi:ZIP family zinc transporter
MGLFFGVFGTTLGGFLAFFINSESKRTLGFILEFAAGLMLSVVCFDLLPEAFELGGVELGCAGVIAGTGIVIILDGFVKKLEIVRKAIENRDVLKAGILMATAISLHNFPEGVAVGSGFEVSVKLGLSIALVIAIHDIPEGMAVALPLRLGGISPAKVIALVFLSGVPTGIGAFFGAILGEISKQVIAICLGFAGGAMMYIVCSELMPEAKRIHRGRLSALGNLLGVLCGILVTYI